MMKNKVFKAFLLTFVFCLFLTAVIVPAQALTSDVSGATVDEVADNSVITYTNPDTGYSLIILDDIDLLTAEEEMWLIEDMKPVTEYGSIAFWSTDQAARDEIDQARLKRKELFEFESASVFVINMGIRKLTIQSYGDIYDNINDSYARSITDNISHYATDQKYYNAASEAYQQIYKVMNGLDIPEPMKIAGYVIMSIIIGLTVALSLAFSAKYNPIRELPIDAAGIQGSGTFSKKGCKKTISKEERAISTSSHSGGGCSSCGGGGGCGGGGSSSF